MISLYVNGDLLDAFENNNFDAIVHGCNCFHLMGAGIAGMISKRFPEAYKADVKLTDKGDWNKLGTYTKAEYLHGDIINAYTQYNPGKCRELDLLQSISKVFKQLDKDYSGKTIGIPKIGAGIAGGNWNIISELINQVTPNLKIVVYYI